MERDNDTTLEVRFGQKKRSLIQGSKGIRQWPIIIPNDDKQSYPIC